MRSLFLIRHGETHLAGRFCGQADPPLNEAGELQAARLAETFTSLGVARIWSSPLLRARQTAEKIAAEVNLPIEFHSGLREIGFGEWEGLHWTEIEARWPHEARRWAEEFPNRSTPQGEPFTEFCSRVDACIAAIIAAAPETVAIVTHRGVMMRALTRFFDYDEQRAREVTATYCACVLSETGLTTRESRQRTNQVRTGTA